jgi:hypothetical protein
VARYCGPALPRGRRGQGKGFQGLAKGLVLQQGVEGREEQAKPVGRQKDRMQGDKDYLRHLGSILGPAEEPAVGRGQGPAAGRGQGPAGARGPRVSLRERVRGEVGRAVEFLATREEFWNQID